MVAPFQLFTPQFFTSFTVLLAVLLPVLAGIARAHGRSAVLAAATAISVCLILAWTLPDPSFGMFPRTDEFLRAFAQPAAVTEALRDVGLSAERQANVLLYIPAGAFAALLARRFTPIAASLSSLSWLIELTQAASGARVGSLPDWVYNTSGAVIGVGLAYVWCRLAGLDSTDRVHSRTAMD